MMPFKRTKPLFLAAFGLSLVGLAINGCKGSAPATANPAPAKTANASATPPGGRFVLRSHTGTVLTDQDFRGDFLLVDFGYTSCPDICPTTLLKLAQVDKLLGDAAKAVQVLFISVDPDRDSPQVLRRYVTRFDPAFIGLTGSKAAVDSVTHKYHVRYELDGKVGPDDEDYAVNHTSAVFFMDPDGRFIARFSYPTPAKQIADTVRAAIAAAPKGRPAP